jgi:hypothetical protein
MRHPRPPKSRHDIIDEALFSFLLRLEVNKSRRLKYYVSVVFMTIESPTDESTTRIARHLTRHLRATDLVVCPSPFSIAFLLVDATERDLPAIIHRIIEEVATLAPPVGERRMVWSAGGASYPKTAGGAGLVLRQAMHLMERARKDGGNRLYLPGDTGPWLGVI